MTAARSGWLFVLPWSPTAIGGVNEVVRNLRLEMLAEGSFTPQLLTTGADDTGAASTHALYLRRPGARWSDWRHNVAFALHFVPSLLRLIRLFRSLDIAVVNQHYVSLTAVYFAVARRLGIVERLILSVHGADLHAIETSGLQRSLWRFVARSADTFVACSAALAETAVSSLPAVRGTATVVHNGVDAARCAAELASVPPCAVERPTILCVATLEHKKGIDVLVEAFERLTMTHANCRLVVVGRRTAYAATLDAQVAAACVRVPSLADRLTLVDGESHPAILARMRAADLFVLPSRVEPFGIVILEAGLMEMPVIASRVGGIPEIVDDGVHGLLVPPEDVDALATAMQTLLDDAALGRTLAHALQRRVRDEFSWAAAWRRYRALASTDIAPH